MASWISRKRVERKREKKTDEEFNLRFRRKPKQKKLRIQGKKTCSEELELYKS